MKSLKLGMLGLAAMFGTMITVSAAECNSNKDDAYASIIKTGAEPTYCATVKDAVDNAQAGDTVQLLKDYTFDSTVETDRIKITKNLTFDFDKYTITISKLPVTNGGIVVSGSSTKVTFVGKGGIERTNGSAALLITDGAEVTINGGTFTKSGATEDGNYNAIDVNASTLTIEEKNGAIVAVTGGIGVFGTNPKLYVKSGTITSDDFAVSGNGSTTTTSTIEITGGTLESTGSAAIYHPQSGTLKISGGDITGKIGIVARGGQVTVSDNAHIVATGKADENYEVGDATDEQGKVKLPGGVGILVDNTENYPDKSNVKATVTGGNFETEGNAVAVYKIDADDEDATDLIEVTGGKFDQDVDAKYIKGDLEQSESGVIGTLHKITTEDNENGKVIVPENAAEGEVVTIGFEPTEGYKVSKVYVDGKEITPDKNGTYTFTMGEEDTKVSAEFISIEASSSIPTTPEPEPENPSTLDKAPLYLALGTIALTGVTALGYMVKKKFEN